MKRRYFNLELIFEQSYDDDFVFRMTPELGYYLETKHSFLPLCESC